MNCAQEIKASVLAMLVRRPRFNIDVGVAQAAGNILPGVNLRARHQVALGISYAF